MVVGEELADREQEECDAPLSFELRFFLKVISTYRNKCTVKEAMEKVKSEKVQKRLKEDTQHQRLADIS